MEKRKAKVKVPCLALLDQTCALNIAAFRIAKRRDIKRLADRELINLLLDLGFEETADQWSKARNGD